jgi:hypothetical protein
MEEADRITRWLTRRQAVHPPVMQSARTGGNAGVRRTYGYTNMDKSEKPKVTWLAAYKVLSKEKSPAIGK